MSETAPTVDAPLSVDAAIASLVPEETPAAEAPVEAAEEQPESEGADQAPEDAPAEDETPAEGEETETEVEAAEPIDPPKYWSKDAKAKFAELPPELQAVVLEQEGPREEAAAKAKAQAAEKTQAAEAEMGKVAQLAQQLGEFLPQAIETFQNRWGNDPDWVALSQEHGIEAVQGWKLQFEAEQKQLQKLVAAKQEADEQSYGAFIKAEAAKLAELAPDLADPEKGPEKRAKVSQYLVANGISPAALKNISASEIVLAHKAMLYDQAQAALKAKPSSTLKPAPGKPTLKPSAATPAASPQRTAQAIANRYAQTRSVDDAVALLVAKGQPR